MQSSYSLPLVPVDTFNFPPVPFLVTRDWVPLLSLLYCSLPDPCSPKGHELYYAAFHGDVEQVQTLLSSGVNPNFKSTATEENTPLLAAAFNGQVVLLYFWWRSSCLFFLIFFMSVPERMSLP